MMFAAPLQPTPMHQHQQFSLPGPSPAASSPFTPVRPSPLSPRRANTAPSRSMTTTAASTSPTSPSPSQFHFQFQGPSSTTAATTPNANAQWPSPSSPSLFPPSPHHPPQSPSPSYAQRYASKIANPMAHQPRAYTASSSSAARSTRRNAFLNRVKQERDAGRFETRGEQLALMEHVAEEKRWGEAMRRRAEGLFEGLDDGGVDVDADVDGNVGDEGLSVEDEVALDEYLRQEDATQTGSWEPDLAPPGQGGGGFGPKDPGSFSDEEYDDIFMDLAQPSQDMDMSG